MPRAHVSVADVLADLARALQPLRVAWYLFGAQALVLRGVPRATADVDVTVLMVDRPSSELVRALRAHGFTVPLDSTAFVSATRVLPVIHAATQLPVDVVLGGPGLEEHFAAHAERLRVGRLTIPVATPTHLVVMKVLAGRPKDLEDAAALLALHDAIDDREVDSLVRMLADALGEGDVIERLTAVRRRVHPTPRRRPKKR